MSTHVYMVRLRAGRRWRVYTVVGTFDEAQEVLDGVKSPAAIFKHHMKTGNEVLVAENDAAGKTVAAICDKLRS